jgi:hypothetical protein
MGVPIVLCAKAIDSINEGNSENPSWRQEDEIPIMPGPRTVCIHTCHCDFTEISGHKVSPKISKTRNGKIGPRRIITEN